MDGYSTYVLNYQDAAGEVYTARIITNDREPVINGRAKLERFYRTLGYEILSADRIEEVAGTGSVVAERPGISVWLYRGMVIAAVALTLGNIGWDTYIYAKLAEGEKRGQADHAKFLERLNQQERLLTRIEKRQQWGAEELEKLIGGRP